MTVLIFLLCLFSTPTHAYQKPTNFDTTVQGGVLFQNAMVDTTVNKVGKFSYNKANRGGAFYAMGGTMRFPNTVKFTSNTATNGGGVFFVGGRIDFTGAVEFDGNKGGGEGGMALNDVANDANALHFNTEPTMMANTGGTYNQTHKHCYVGSEKRPNCCPGDKPNWNATNGTCNSTCTGGQTWNDTACTCPNEQTFNENSGKCQITRTFVYAVDDCIFVYIDGELSFKSLNATSALSCSSQLKSHQQWHTAKGMIPIDHGNRVNMTVDFINSVNHAAFVFYDQQTKNYFVPTSASCTYTYPSTFNNGHGNVFSQYWIVMPYRSSKCTFQGYIDLK